MILHFAASRPPKATATRARRSRRSEVALGLLLSALWSCGGQQQPKTAEQQAEPEPSQAASETAAPSDEPASATSSEITTATNAAPTSEAKSAPTVEPLLGVCKKMCDSLSSKCTKDQVKRCHLSYCDKYVPDEPACDEAARAAFDCAQTQKDFLLCSNVVPEVCAKKFIAVDKCAATGVAPEREKTANEIPAGWQRYEARDAGFSVIIPQNVEVKSEAGNKVWSAKAGDATYDITLQSAPNEPKFDQKAFLRIATKLLGKCAPKMKLNSLVERDTHTLIHFRTVCPDQTQQRGVLYVDGKEFFVVRARWGAGPNPDADTFAYSFERKD